MLAEIRPEDLENYRSSLVGFLYRIVLDRPLADDLAQQTIIRAWEKRTTFQGNSSLKTWVYAIAINYVRSELRNRKPFPRNAQDLGKALAESDPQYHRYLRQLTVSDPAAIFEVKDYISTCFSCVTTMLPLDQQLALLLVEIGQFSNKEVASILGRPLGTVKHWLLLARRQMVEIFDARCSLVSKRGACFQCSELNGWFNPRRDQQKDLVATGLTHSASIPEKRAMLRLRSCLIAALDPSSAPGFPIQDGLLQLIRQAVAQSSVDSGSKSV